MSNTRFLEKKTHDSFVCHFPNAKLYEQYMMGFKDTNHYEREYRLCKEMFYLKKRMYTMERHVNDPLISDLSFEEIIAIVSSHTKVPYDCMQAKCRLRDYVFARQLAQYFLSKYTLLSLKSIGGLFGNRDHSTVLHAKRAINNLLDTNELVQKMVFDLEHKIRPTQ